MRQFEIMLLAGYDPEIGRWMWALQAVRRRPEWAAFHLVEHEAGHAFQISSLRARGTRMLA